MRIRISKKSAYVIILVFVCVAVIGIGYALFKLTNKQQVQLVNTSKYYKLSLVKNGTNFKQFLTNNHFWDNYKLYHHEKATYFSPQGKNIKIILTDELQQETQRAWGDFPNNYFIGSSVGAVITNNEIILKLHLDKRLKQRLTKEELSALANVQIAQRIFMMTNPMKEQDKIKQLVTNKINFKFFYVQ